MKIFFKKKSKKIVFFSLFLHLLMILGIPFFENLCQSYTCQGSDLCQMQVCCISTMDNSSTNNNLEENVHTPFEHNSRECDNDPGFICNSCKQIVSIINIDPQKKLSNFTFMNNENKNNVFIAKENTTSLCSPQNNSTNFNIQSVVLLI